MAQGSEDPDGGMCHHRKYYVSGCVAVWGGVKAWMILKKDPLIVGTMATWGTSNITFDIDIDCHEY